MSPTLLESTRTANSLQHYQRNRVHVPSFPLATQIETRRYKITEHVKEPEASYVVEVTPLT